LTGNNQAEVILTPAQVYDRVRITLDAGLLGVTSSIYLYDAFYGSGPGLCNTAIDELHGISSALLGLGLNIGGVANPQLAIDGDITTASTLNAGVAVLGSFAQQTVIYNSLSVIGDSVRVTLGITPALISAGVLQNIALSTFNGNTSNNDTKTLSSALLIVKLLGITGGIQKVVVTFVPTAIFDRVQLRLGGGIANVLSTLNFYEAQHILPSPVVTVNGVATNNTQICSGANATLTATAVTNTVFNWYTVPTSGTAVFTGAVFTTPALATTTTYYVEAMRNGCTDASQRTAVVVTVNPLPATAIITANTATICQGQTATFTAQATTGVTVKWYATATGGTPLFTGNTFTTTVLKTSTNYYAEAVNATGCAAAQRTQVSVTVNPSPVVPTLSIAAITINAGQTATISVTNPQTGIIYNWYTAATGGTIAFTGTTFTTAALTATTTYYVEAASSTCISPSRAQVTITVNQLPNVTVVPATQAVNVGQTATLTASSTTPNAIFNWYTAATGGTSIFTGATFTTPPIIGNTTYYAEAKDPNTGAISATRASGAITVNASGGGTAPNIAVTPPTQAVNAGQTATFTASSTTPNATFAWYTTPTGGTPVFTGAVFTTPPINGNITYYAEAKDPVSGLVSTTRATGMVTVNGGGTTGPDVTVNPATQAVNAGQSATFTATSTTPNAAFNWFTTPTGGTSIFTGAVFTTPAISSNTTYYAEAKNPTSGAVSPTRATGTVTVNAGSAGNGPSITITPPTQAVNAGQTATLMASSTTPNAIFNWYTTPTGGTPIFTGATFTSPPINGNVTYYADATDPATGIISSTRATGSVTVNGGGGTTGPDIAVTPPTQAINASQTATFTATSTTANATFNWYTVPTGGTSIFTGSTFTSPALSSNTTYYAEATSPTTGAVSPTRATGMVTINASGGGTAPDVAVTPPTQAVNAGQAATFTASSTTPNAIFNWYTVPTGGTSIFTGATFTSPPINGNVTYYAEAKDPVGGLVSTTRATGMVTVNGGGTTGPNVTVTPPTQAVNSGQTATFTASSTAPGTTFTWYTAPSGGAPIFTGSVFTTPPISANITYYAEAKDPTGAVSPTRATGMVIVNTGGGGNTPNVAVTPQTQTVNIGQVATFTASSTTPGETFTWYTTPTGGSPIFTGATFTTPPVNGDMTYYAQATDPTTGATSTTRASGTVTVNPAPSIAVTPPTQAVNNGQTATLTASSTTPGAIFNWYTTPTSSISIFTGPVFTTPPVTSNTTYYAEAKDPATGAPSLTRASGTVTVNPSPSIAVTPPTQAVNNGQTAIFTASSTTPGAIFYWYTTPTGGTSIFTGPAFTTSPLTGNITYYAEAKDPATGALSLTRASGTVTINPVPDVTVTPTTVTIFAGLTTRLTATSTTPNAIFNWYTTATGGTSIFTGAIFTTPAINANIIYYAEATNPITEALSLTRATGTITLNGAVTGIYMPNAFTPNNDGKNDILYVYGPNIKSLHLWVYDQWGELQFQSTNQANGWDGTYKGRAQPVGVYVYYVEATTNDGQLIKKKGTITLLR
jgi:gliding motility-associated-like protein